MSQVREFAIERQYVQPGWCFWVGIRRRIGEKSRLGRIRRVSVDAGMMVPRSGHRIIQKPAVIGHPAAPQRHRRDGAYSRFSPHL